MNSMTERTNGIFVDKSQNKTYEKYIHNLMFWLSYYICKGIAIRIINIKRELEDKKLKHLKMSLKTYKMDYNSKVNFAFTYIPNDKLTYYKPDKKKYETKFNYMPEEVGICEFENIKFIIPEAKHGFKIKDIVFTHCEQTV